MSSEKTANVRSVIFDLGGVVLRWNPESIITSFSPDELTQSVIRRDVFQHPDWLDMDRGVLPEQQAIQRFHMRTECSLAEISALMQAVKDSLQPIPGTVELLEELAQLEVPLYCLSNMPATTADYLRAQHTFWRLFRGVVISGEVNLVKPDPAIFRYIASRYGLTPQDTTFVDDHSPNIESAARLGFRTVLFKDPAQCRDSLQDLL